MQQSPDSIIEKLKPSTDLLWPLGALLAFGFIVSIMPLPASDFWWHLKIGELIYTEGSIPTTNIFGWTLPQNQPFFYGAWLGEYLMYVIYHWGGLELVIFVRNLLAMVAFWLIAAEAHRQSRSWRLSTLVFALAGGMAINNLVVRPQMWSWLPFVVFLLVLNRYAEGHLRARWLCLCPVLMVFWVNVHGAFVLGIVLLCIFSVGEGLRTLLRQPGARSRHEVGWLAGIGLLTGLAALINPRSFRIFGYVRDLLVDEASQQLIMEWQSPVPKGMASSVFYASILVLLLAWAYSVYRPTSTEALLVVGLLWLAWSGLRYVIWYGLASLPILVRAMSKLPVKAPTLASSRNWLNLAILLLLCVAVLAVQPWFIEQVPLPESYWERVHRNESVGPLVEIATPLKATEYLRTHPGGRLFNDMGYGSYLIWALPEQGVFVDPRVELYPLDQWEDYVRIGQSIHYSELLTRYGVDRILLDTEYQPELAMALETDPGWQREYQDERAEIWTRVY